MLITMMLRFCHGHLTGEEDEGDIKDVSKAHIGNSFGDHDFEFSFHSVTVMTTNTCIVQ